MIARTCIAVIALVLLGGCAVRIGGPGPVEYRTVALSTGHGTAPDEVARWIRDANANVVLLSAAADSAWFDAVARQTRMTLSGPGRAGPSSLAFLAHEALGDTTVALNLASGDEIVIHDALYRIDKHRYLDLIALRVDPGQEARDVVRTLLGYVATDVMSSAVTVLAVDVPTPEMGDSIATLLDPAFQDVNRCLSGGNNRPSQSAGMRLFYGPQARIRCNTARLLGESGPVLAHLIVAH